MLPACLHCAPRARTLDAAIYKMPKRCTQAVDYLHYRRVVHGDIKPDNILMSASGAVAREAGRRCTAANSMNASACAWTLG